MLGGLVGLTFHAFEHPLPGLPHVISPWPGETNLPYERHCGTSPQQKIEAASRLGPRSLAPALRPVLEVVAHMPMAEQKGSMAEKGCATHRLARQRRRRTVSGIIGGGHRGTPSTVAGFGHEGTVWWSGGLRREIEGDRWPRQQRHPRS